MSEKELAIKLIENVPAHKLGYVIAYLQGITADEADDDAFCEKLCAEYVNSSEKGQYVSLSEMIKMCEVNPDAL